MTRLILIISVFSVLSNVLASKVKKCYPEKTIDRSLRDVYCDQPLFVTFLPKNHMNELIDNICFTLFPLPDNPDTFQLYRSKVYCDGSSEVESFIGTTFGTGIHRIANPFLTATYAYFGYAGCDTYLSAICDERGDVDDAPVIGGLSSSCKPMGLSCLRKVEEIVRDNGLPDMDYYVLPMKLPNRCVTQQQCLAPQGNQFYKALGLAGPLHPY